MLLRRHPRIENRLKMGYRGRAAASTMPALSRTRVLALAALAAAVCLPAASAGGDAHARIARLTPGTWCGGTRWRMMTLSDPQRRLVDLHRQPTTIGSIASLQPPRRALSARSTTFQRRVWQLRTVVDRYRIASNGEIVLILYSIDTAQYMNAYLPNPRCLGPRARDRTGMLSARKQFTSHCPQVTPAWQLLGATIDIAGVGFWNPSRTTRGALPTGAELRPVTNLRIVSGCGIW